MLVLLDDMKNYLDIPLVDTTYDAFLTSQITIISEAIEGYCGRKFNMNSYVQTFYLQDFQGPQKKLFLFQYPIDAIQTITDADLNDIEDLRIHKETGLINLMDDYLLRYTRDKVIVTYTAGYTDIPPIIQSVVYDLVEQRYNKKKSGVALNFGTDVQRVSIPGTISIDFDYTLTMNDRKNKYGNILGNTLNLLDPYRSERGLGQQGTLEYVSY